MSDHRGAAQWVQRNEQPIPGAGRPCVCPLTIECLPIIILLINAIRRRIIVQLDDPRKEVVNHLAHQHPIAEVAGDVAFRTVQGDRVDPTVEMRQGGGIQLGHGCKGEEELRV